MPIYNSIEIHFQTNDPYSSFMNNVYLDVTEFSDNFETTDLKLRLETEVNISYTVNLGLEFILLEDEFFELVKNLAFINNDALDKVSTILVLTNFIMEYIQDIEKIEYQKLIEELYEEIHANLIDLGDLEVLFIINPKLIELILEDLARINIIDLKGETIVKYNDTLN